jgi:protein-S-isoprenylcysteine O-methyltransferase Ste14
MGQPQDRADRPNRVPWPPLIYGAAAILAVALGWLWPTPNLFPGERVLGVAAMLAGIGLDGAAMLTMHRHHANILPHRAATALVTTWPFSISRNPIYLGNTILLVGAGLAFGDAWFLPLALIAAFATARLAIAREEAHLAARFGAAWAAYASRTPRWVRLGR